MNSLAHASICTPTSGFRYSVQLQVHFIGAQMRVHWASNCTPLDTSSHSTSSHSTSAHNTTPYGIVVYVYHSCVVLLFVTRVKTCCAPRCRPHGSPVYRCQEEKWKQQHDKVALQGVHVVIISVKIHCIIAGVRFCVYRNHICFSVAVFSTLCLLI